MLSICKVPIQFILKIVKITNIFEHLVCAKYHATFFTCVVSFNSHKPLRGRYCCNLYFPDVETEAQRGQVP